MTRVRLVLADDDEGILQRLRNLLEKDFNLVAAVSDGRSAVEAVGQYKPDLAILDLSMPLLNGIDATRTIKEDHPKGHPHAGADSSTCANPPDPHGPVRARECRTAPTDGRRWTS